MKFDPLQQQSQSLANAINLTLHIHNNSNTSYFREIKLSYLIASFSLRNKIKYTKFFLNKNN